MMLRDSFAVLCACLALSACDDGSGGTTTSSSTSGGDSSTTDPTNVSISISVSATTPTTDPSSTTEGTATDGTATDDATTDDATTDDSATDGSTSTGAESGSTTTGGQAGVTIYDVQDGTIAEGETVVLQGVVITGLREFVGVVVQEVDGGEYSGVYVDTADVDLSAFSVGDIVDLTGVTAESNPDSTGLDDLTQILLGMDGTMTATGDTLTPEPETVDFAVLADPGTAEPWESVLVTTTGSFTAVTFGDFFGQFGEFAAQDGGDMLVVDNFLYAIFDAENAADFPGFGEGATFTELSGVLNYTFGNFKLAPRSAVELGGYTAPAG